MFGEIAASFQKGNPYILIMLGIAFLGVTVFFERVIMLQFVYSLDFRKFITNLKKMITAEDLHRAITFCKGVSNTSLPHIARRALEAADTDPTTVRGTIEEETISFLPRVEARIHLLTILATLTIILGVLAAIDSLWHVFHAAQLLDTGRKQATLASEIASSLNPAAFGLLIAALLLSAHHVVKALGLRLLDQVNLGVTMLQNLLAPSDITTAAMMPVAAAAMPAEAPAPAPEQKAPAAAPAGDQQAAESGFDESSVEDIRDEEEII